MMGTDKKPIQQYYNLYYKKSIAVLGGGPNLIDDLKLLPKETIKISVNHHAQIIVNCKYLVFLDNPDNYLPLLKKLSNYNGIKVTPGNKQKYSDILFTKGSFPPCSISSIFALWFAEYLGSSPVILCGMDLFQNKKQSHCGSIPGVKYGNIDLMTLDDHKKPWLQYRCLNKENIFVCSGPLIGLFNKWGGV
ncbi:hypothetical protein KAR91_48940 [Candidatus Pacearchaeota archaeon]|nr:hypothetical protein [Candidatus Pacearchaeota archaeon]